MEKSGPRHILLLLLFALFVVFLYGPTLTIFILSFQGPDGDQPSALSLWARA